MALKRPHQKLIDEFHFEGRDVRGRLKAHLNSREKVGQVEKTSEVYIHMMVTEFMVLDAFEQDAGAIPVLNKRKSQKHV